MDKLPLSSPDWTLPDALAEIRRLRHELAMHTAMENSVALPGRLRDYAVRALTADIWCMVRDEDAAAALAAPPDDTSWQQVHLVRNAVHGQYFYWRTYRNFELAQCARAHVRNGRIVGVIGYHCHPLDTLIWCQPCRFDRDVQDGLAKQRGLAVAD